MTNEARVLVAGAGPVGLVAAVALARGGVPVTVLESGADLSEESRASTFHPPTLDMLDELGAAAPLIAKGLIAPTLQYRTNRDGPIAEFDFGAIADLTRHPYRLQAEQFKLTRVLYELYRGHANFSIEFASAVAEVSQDAQGVSVRVRRHGKTEERRGRWLIGADGARSAVRRALGIEFEGFTWPERFLVVTTPFDFRQAIADLAPVSYVADPRQWHFLLRIPGMWRVVFPVPPEIDDEQATARDYIRDQMASVVPAAAEREIAHRMLYRVHQRVAKRYRRGRVLLAGDAAHVNNPLGGMGMNGGIHDAVNLAARLIRVWRGEAGEDELDRYERQRRLVTIEYVQAQTIQNKKNLEARDPAEHAEFKRRMRETAGDPRLAYDYLLKLSMIASLRRAAELG
jgi:2-polyprenyl-6-methoxyphenol hydroxylase-like FAD-dependent oxidoreductase